MDKKLDRSSIFAIATVFVIFTISLFSPQVAHATTNTLYSSTCVSVLYGIWDNSKSTCNKTNSVNVYLDGLELVIPSGTTLIVNGSGTIESSDGSTITNYGDIKIYNAGRIYLYAYLTSEETIDNYGTIIISNTGSTGIELFGGEGSEAIFNNYSGGQIIISNTGGIGLDTTGGNGGYIYNNSGGQITVSNKGISSIGISNNDYYSYGTITNNGTITNSGTIINYEGGFGIENYGTINNKNLINNNGTISDSGTINNECGGSITGNPVTGNPVINDCDLTKTTVSPNPSNLGLLASIIFAGKVTDTNTTATVPNGTLTWSDEGMGGTFSIGSLSTNNCTLSTVNTITSSCKITYKPSPAARIGTIITINSTYSGDGSHGTSSGISKLTIARATMTAISPINATITHGTTYVFNATVTDTSSGTKISPTGKVSWTVSKSGGTFSSGMCILVAINKSQSQCIVTYTAPSTAGSITISALYGGYGTHATSMGTAKLKVT